MRELNPNMSSKRRSILGAITVLMFMFYVLCLLFYQNVVLPVAVPLLLLGLAGVNGYQGITKIQNEAHGAKWYTQYNIMLAFAWLSGLPIFPFYYLRPIHLLIEVQYITIGLPPLSMIAFFVYAFFLYRRNHRSIISTRYYDPASEEQREENGKEGEADALP